MGVDPGVVAACGPRAWLALHVARASLERGGGNLDADALVREAVRLAASRSQREQDRFAPGLFEGLAPGALEEAAVILSRGPSLAPHELGALLEELRAGSAARKRSGSWYTSRRLAAATTSRVLEGRYESEPRVLDPACGAGAFLLEVLEQLLPRLGPRATLRAIHGVDRDPLAVDVARAALWLAMGDPELPIDAFHSGIRCGDALLGLLDSKARPYPVGAFARGAGDGAHDFGTGHAPRSWDQALREQRRALRGLVIEEPTGTFDRGAADLWCALWFWPPDRLEEVPGPLDPPSPGALEEIEAIAARERFFHWSLEWPEVMERGGFDAVLGNPPWEVDKPDSRQWFTELDPAYRDLGKQEALAWQGERFRADPQVEREWLLEGARHRARTHWFGEHGARAAADRNTYALFLERSLDLLREDGRLGMLVPAGLASDRGTRDLRVRLLDETRWDWLFTFENRRGLFDIHRSYTFCIVVLRKGGSTESVRTSFGREDAADWEEPGEQAFDYPREWIERTSPTQRAFLPFRCRRDRELYERIQSVCVPLGDSDWNLEYRREIDLTLDSKHFRSAEDLAHTRVDEAGRRIGTNGRGVTEVWLPLYQGSMVQHHDYAAKGWDGARWRSGGGGRVQPRHFISEELYRTRRTRRGPKLVFRDVARATDARSLIPSIVPDFPCGNVLPVLEVEGSPAPLAALLGSFVVDWTCRQRLTGAHLNRYWLEELPILPRERVVAADAELGELLWSLLAPHPELHLARGGGGAAARARIEALVAGLYGLESTDLAWILRDCDRPSTDLPFPDADPRGFWRVDRDLTPERRATILALRTYCPESPERLPLGPV